MTRTPQGALPQATRSVWLLLAALAALSVLSGCPSTQGTQGPKGKPSAVLGLLAPIEAALDARRYPEAAAQVDALLQRFPDDPCVGAAHLLRGRALLGSQGWGESAAALNMAQTLGCDGEPAVGAAASHYKSLAALRRGGVERGLEAAQAAAVPLPTEPSRWLPSADAAPLLWLSAERRARQGDPSGALTLLARALSVADPADVAFSASLRDRAWSLTTQPLAIPSDAPPFARAVAAYPRALSALAAPDPSAAASADAAALIAEAVALLDAAGEADRAALLRQLAAQDPDARAALRASDRAPLLVGAVLPLSGPNRKVGRMAMAGMLLRLGAFTPGAQPQITLLFEDDGGQPERAAAAVRKLASAGAALILGPLDPDSASAAAEAAAQAGVPLLALSAAPLRAPSPLVWRLAPSAAAEADALCQHLRAQAPPDAPPLRVLALHPDLPYGAQMTAALSDALNASGAGALTATRAYPPDATDLRKLAAEIARLDFDAVFIPDTPDRAARVASFLAQENLWPRPSADASPAARGDARRFFWLLGTSVWMQDDYSALKPLAHGLFPSAFGADKPGDAPQAFARAFALTFGRPPNLIDALAFDALTLARAAHSAGASTPAAMGAALRAVSTYASADADAVTAPLSLTGDAVTPTLRVVQISGGRPVWVAPAPPALTP